MLNNLEIEELKKLLDPVPGDDYYQFLKNYQSREQLMIDAFPKLIEVIEELQRQLEIV